MSDTPTKRMEYRVTAQCTIGSQRIERVVYAASIDAALLAVSPELHEAGYHPVSIVRPIVLAPEEA